MAAPGPGNEALRAFPARWRALRQNRAMAHLHPHSHGHDHGSHAHGGGDPHDEHALASAATLGAFRTGTLLNLALVAIELVAGVWLGSMALLGDAGHNAGDVLGLLLAWGAARLATRKPTARHTYGLARSTILAALLNAGLLLVACGALAWESVQRIGSPHPVPGVPVMLVAFAGVLVNAGTAAMFWRSRKRDANARGAFLHMVADAGVSLGVVVVGGLVALTGWTWLDPAAGLAIAVAIGLGSIGLLREAVDLSLDAVPRGLDLAKIEDSLRSVRTVRSVHDLHVWAMSTTVAALTAHIEHDGTRDTDALLADVQEVLRAKWGIAHSTIQFENVGCGQRC